MSKKGQISNVTCSDGIYYGTVTLTDGQEWPDTILYWNGAFRHPQDGDPCKLFFPDNLSDSPIAILPTAALPTGAPSTSPGDAILCDDTGNAMLMGSAGTALNATASKPFAVGGTDTAPASGLVIASSLRSVFDTWSGTQTDLAELKVNLLAALLGPVGETPPGPAVTQTLTGA